MPKPRVAVRVEECWRLKFGGGRMACAIYRYPSRRFHLRLELARVAGSGLGPPRSARSLTAARVIADVLRLWAIAFRRRLRRAPSRLSTE